jgi:hypothetical protein
MGGDGGRGKMDGVGKPLSPSDCDCLDMGPDALSFCLGLGLEELVPVGGGLGEGVEGG